MDAEAAVAGCRDAFERLLAALDRVGFDDEVARRPSALPDWTVGHVVTHLARNADSMVRLVSAAARDEHALQYAGGLEQRATEIDAGAGRPAGELLDDLRLADDALGAVYAATTAPTWARTYLRWGDQPWPVAEQPFLRWREVALHAVDLGLPGIDSSIWADEYVDHELRRQVASLAVRLPRRACVVVAPADAPWSTTVLRMGDADPSPPVRVDCSSRDALAWMTGRANGDDTWPTLSPWEGAP